MFDLCLHLYWHLYLHLCLPIPPCCYSPDHPLLHSHCQYCPNLPTWVRRTFQNIPNICIAQCTGTSLSSTTLEYHKNSYWPSSCKWHWGRSSRCACSRPAGTHSISGWSLDIGNLEYLLLLLGVVFGTFGYFLVQYRSTMQSPCWEAQHF